MSFPYKNPIASIQSQGTQSVPRSNTFGVTSSVNNIGGYMEVFSLSDLYYTIPVGTTGSIEYSGNTIPIVVITIPIEKITAFILLDLLVINDVKMGCVHVVFSLALHC